MGFNQFRSYRPLASRMTINMPIITKIQQQKDKNRVNIYLDGKFGFGIDLENFVKLRLKIEQELSEDEIAEILKKAEFTKTLNKLVKFAMTRPRSEKEYRDWFWRKKVHESMHKKLLERLEKLKMLNDREFARWWVEQRLEFRHASKRIMNYELRIKGVNKDIIDELLNELVTEETELKNAKELIEKNAYKWKKYEPEKAKEKKIGFLQRKGFGWDVVKKAVERYIY